MRVQEKKKYYIKGFPRFKTPKNGVGMITKARESFTWVEVEDWMQNTEDSKLIALGNDGLNSLLQMIEEDELKGFIPVGVVLSNHKEFKRMCLLTRVRWSFHLLIAMRR